MSKIYKLETTEEYVIKNGISFHGWRYQFKATHNQLVKLFGEPQYKNGDWKINFMWTLKDENGFYYDIYNWKNMKPYDVKGKTSDYITKTNKRYRIVWNIRTHTEKQSEEFLTFIEANIKNGKKI